MPVLVVFIGVHHVRYAFMSRRSVFEIAQTDIFTVKKSKASQQGVIVITMTPFNIFIERIPFPGFCLRARSPSVAERHPDFPGHLDGRTVHRHLFFSFPATSSRGTGTISLLTIAHI